MLKKSWSHFVETFSRVFLDDRESKDNGYHMSTKWAFVLYMDMCTPNTIDIGLNFSINQGSLVFDLGPVFL